MLSFRPQFVLAVASSCAMLVQSTAFATVDVAIVAAATNSPITSERFTDLADVLAADGRFGTIDIISTTPWGTGTPELDQLMQYDSIIHWTNDSNLDSESLGNVFADYVDTGRGLIQALFSNTSPNQNRYLTGRWLTGNYNIIPPMGGFTQLPTASGVATETAHMSAPLEPDHPVFDGVGEVRLSTGQFTTGGLWGAYRPTTTALEPNARKLALWEDGKTAVAVSDAYPNRLDLGFHPVSDLVADGYYDRTSDAGRLIANALIYTAGFASGPDGDFNDDGIFDCTDIDLLVSNIASGSGDLDFDLNGDGSLDVADKDEWLVQAGAFSVSVTGGNPFLPGDANLDGFVDTTDFNAWNNNKFTDLPAWCSGDFNADGSVDTSDFNIWNVNKFTASNMNVVPEPNAMLLVCLGILPLFQTSRGRTGRFGIHSKSNQK